MRTRTLFLAAFLLPSAWAGIGDIDPQFGAGGQLESPEGYLGPIAGPVGSLRYYALEEAVARIRQFDPQGLPDPSFGVQGVQASSIGVRAGSMWAIRVQPDASAYFAIFGVEPGAPAPDNADRPGALVRFDPAGRHDATFGTAGRVDFAPWPGSGARIVYVESMAQASDGSIYVFVGYYRNYYDCAAELRVHRLDATGRVLRDFGDEGSIDYPIGDCHEVAPTLIALDGARLLVSAEVRQIVEPEGALGPAHLPQDWEGRWGWPSFFDEAGSLYSLNTLRTGTQWSVIVGRWRRDLTPDPAFGGANAGYVEFDLPSLASTGASYYPGEIARYASPASPLVYLGLAFYDGPGGAGTLVARMTPQGELDRSFGDAGFARSHSVMRNIVPLFDGGVLLQTQNSLALRLLDEDRASPGRVGIEASCRSGRSIRRADRLFSLKASRELGSDGYAEIRYRTLGGTATADVDFTPTQGAMGWDDGETGSQLIDVRISPDSAAVQQEYFDIALETSAGGAPLECPSVRVTIASEAVVSPPAQGGASNSGGGGGGAMDPGVLLGLLAGVLAQRRGKRMLTSAVCLPSLPH